MEMFLDHMAFVCLAAVVIGLVLAIPCAIVEWLDDKFDGKISNAVIKFWSEDEK